MAFIPGESVVYLLAPQEHTATRAWTAGLALFDHTNAEGLTFVRSTMTEGWEFAATRVFADTPANRRRAQAFVERANAEFAALLARQAEEIKALG